MPYYSISAPARFCRERNKFELLKVIVDIENGRIEFVSEDTKDVIKFDLIGVAALEETLREIANNEHFQSALREKIAEQGGGITS